MQWSRYFSESWGDIGVAALVPDAAKIQALMYDKGLSQFTLAVEADVAKATIENLLGDKHKTCHPRTLKKVARVLGCRSSDLVLSNMPLVASHGDKHPRSKDDETFVNDGQTTQVINAAPIPYSFYGRFSAYLNRHLVGRDRELEILSRSWLDPATHILILIGIGGLGKTALVKRWLDTNASLLRDKLVYVWSFSGQDNCSPTLASDEFLTHLAAFLGYDYQPSGNLRELVDHLIRFFQKHPVVLVLDGLEVLQKPPGPNAGSLGDDDLVLRLLLGLAARNPGLCIITSRIAIDNLASSLDMTARELQLEPLADDAAEELLSKMGATLNDPRLKREIKILQPTFRTKTARFQYFITP